jgi:hypothetical protein
VLSLFMDYLALSSYGMLVATYQVIQHNIPEHLHLHNYIWSAVYGTYKFPTSRFMIILPTKADLSHADGWTGMTQQSLFLQPFTNLSKNRHKERLKNIVLVASSQLNLYLLLY